MGTYHDVKSIKDLAGEPDAYRAAVQKIVVSHAVNELHGARVYDEPAIDLAPTPYAKWLTCRVAMEEYHHHLRFKHLADDMGLPESATGAKKPLSIFGFKLETWPQFCVIKLLADLAEILQVEDLLHCSFIPLRTLARITMPEEKFHHEFGVEFCTALVATPSGRKAVQAAIDAYFPILPAFFGAAGSKNNEAFRRFGLKLRKNEEMLADYVKRARKAVEALGLTLPELPERKAA